MGDGMTKIKVGVDGIKMPPTTIFSLQAPLLF